MHACTCCHIIVDDPQPSCPTCGIPDGSSQQMFCAHTHCLLRWQCRVPGRKSHQRITESIREGGDLAAVEGVQVVALKEVRHLREYKDIGCELRDDCSVQQWQRAVLASRRPRLRQQVKTRRLRLRT